MCLQENKETNLELAIKNLNDVIIKPSQTFFIWRLVGKPRKEKGYLEELTWKHCQISKDPGGGLYQLGNLFFWIFAHSKLTITERYKQGFVVFPETNRTVPFGRSGQESEWLHDRKTLSGKPCNYTCIPHL
jgi:vancomycin resistance protein VanW